jgi:hypothetical protein
VSYLKPFTRLTTNHNSLPTTVCDTLFGVTNSSLLAARRAASRRALLRTRKILNDIIGPERAGNVGIRLWDNSLWPDDLPRRTVLHLKHPGALRAVFLRLHEIQSCEATFLMISIWKARPKTCSS